MISNWSIPKEDVKTRISQGKGRGNQGTRPANSRRGAKCAYRTYNSCSEQQ